VIVGVLTTCHSLEIAVYVIFYLIEQHSKFLWHTVQVLYMCTLCDSTNINTKIECQHVAFSLPFAAILVNCAPSGEMHNYCTPHMIKENLENFLIHRCNYILLSQVYCVWQVVKTLTIISNNPVHWCTRLPLCHITINQYCMLSFNGIFLCLPGLCFLLTVNIQRCLPPAVRMILESGTQKHRWNCYAFLSPTSRALAYNFRVMGSLS